MGRPAPGEKEQQMRTIYLNPLLDNRKRRHRLQPERRLRVHWDDRRGRQALRNRVTCASVTCASWGRRTVIRNMGDQRLRPGDLVEVRAPGEILATLDGEASIESMPFMPEMLQYAVERYTVTRRVEKICGTVSGGPARSLWIATGLAR